MRVEMILKRPTQSDGVSLFNTDYFLVFDDFEIRFKQFVCGNKGTYLIVQDALFVMLKQIFNCLVLIEIVL